MLNFNLNDKWPLLELLRKKDFLFLWLANGFWWQALWIESILIGWLTFEITNSAWSLSVAGFCRAIPLLIIGPTAPIVMNSFSKRTILRFLQGGAVFSNTILTVIHLTYGITYTTILVYCLFMGTLWSIDWPTRRSILPDIVGDKRIVDGVLLENVLQSFSRVIGPVGGGYALAVIGISGSLVTLTIISIAGLICLLTIEINSVHQLIITKKEGVINELLEGLRFVRRQTAVLGVFVITLIMNVWAFPFSTILPAIARDVLNQGPVGLGLLAAVNGLGVTLGLTIINKFKNKLRNEFVFVSGSFMVCIGLFLFSLTDDMASALIFLFLSGIGQAGFSVMQSSIILNRVPDTMRSQTMGIIVFAIGFSPLGKLQAGATAEFLNCQIAVTSMALIAGIGLIFIGFYIKEYGLYNAIDQK